MTVKKPPEKRHAKKQNPASSQSLEKKRWKENTKNYRSRKENLLRTERFLLQNSPASSVVSNSEQGHASTAQTGKKNAGRKRVKRNRTAAYRQIKKLEACLRSSERRAGKYKKRLQRLQHDGEHTWNSITRH